MLLEQRGDGRVALLPAFLGAGQADLGHAGAHRHDAADERGAAGGATLLAVVVGERHAFARDAVDVRRHVAHHAAAVVADVPGADIVTPDDENVRWPPRWRRLRLCLRRLAGCRGSHRRCCRHRGAGEKNVATAETFF